MKYKFVTEEDDSKCLTRLLNKTEIRNSIVLTIIPTFEISFSLRRISYLKIRLHLLSLTLTFKSLSLTIDFSVEHPQSDLFTWDEGGGLSCCIWFAHFMVP
jgi:hypothetical protein